MPKPKTTFREDVDSAEETLMPETKFVPVDGRWSFKSSMATYEGPAPYEGTGEQQRSHGVCLAATRFRSGTLEVRANIEDPSAAARLVFGYNAGSGAYYSVGINGWYRAYVLASN